MKYIGRLSTLVTVVLAALIIVCPVASRAADQAPDSCRGGGSESAQECPLVRPFAPADHTAAGGEQAARTDLVMLWSAEGNLQTAESGDSSGALLEDLISKAQDR
jgi:hypothetical protein